MKRRLFLRFHDLPLVHWSPESLSARMPAASFRWWRWNGARFQSAIFTLRHLPKRRRVKVGVRAVSNNSIIISLFWFKTWRTRPKPTFNYRPQGHLTTDPTRPDGQRRSWHCCPQRRVTSHECHSKAKPTVVWSPTCLPAIYETYYWSTCPLKSI